MVSDKLGRRSSHERQSSGKRVRLNDRDRLWLQKLNQHGPLPTSYLLAFSAGLRASDKRQQERLGDLFHEGNTEHGGAYLDRPPQQYATLKAGYNQAVHQLAKAGREALEECGEYQSTASHTGPWIHRHMVACITASFELATLGRSDVSFIHQHTILKRAKTYLRCSLRIEDVETANEVRKDLQPDAVFGLAYHSATGDRFRFFVVEADRGTEPVSSRNWNRKSFARHLVQYQSYVEDGAYRDHLKLTAPLLVLNVCPDQKRIDLMLRQTAQQQPQCSYQLFQAFAAFKAPWRPPEPNHALLGSAWQRAGLPDFSIDEL